MNKPAVFSESESFKVRFTADEFVRLLFSDVFEDARLELIDGELLHMSPPSGGHGSKQAAAIVALAPIARSAGLHIVGEIAIRVDEATVVVCDAALLRRLPADRTAVNPADIVLVVEIAETTRSRDLGFKRTAYARAGVPVYWVIDGDRHVVHVFQLGPDGNYADADRVPIGAPITLAGLNATITID